MNYNLLIDKYYPEDNELRHILINHSQSVARKALQIVSSHPELHLDAQFVEEAAMLHDLGIFRTDAPGIQCFGSEPYICHGRLGAEILRKEGYERHARVCDMLVYASDIRVPESLARKSSHRDCRCLTKTFCQKQWRRKSSAMLINSSARRTSTEKNPSRKPRKAWLSLERMG